MSKYITVYSSITLNKHITVDFLSTFTAVPTTSGSRIQTPGSDNHSFSHNPDELNKYDETNSAYLRVGGGSEAIDDTSLSIDQELGEVPLDGIDQSAALQKFTSLLKPTVLLVFFLFQTALNIPVGSSCIPTTDELQNHSHQFSWPCQR